MTAAKPNQTMTINAGTQVQAVTAAPKPKVADGQAALLALLKVEADARDAASERDLVFLIANETRKLTRARQIFVLRAGLRGNLDAGPRRCAQCADAGDDCEPGCELSQPGA